MASQIPTRIIVCFGDSLTLGYQSPTIRSPVVEHTPYGAYLQEWAGDHVRFLVRGVCGETTEEMTARFQQDVVRCQPDIVCILGGTNDLGLGISPDAVLDNLRGLYEAALTQGVSPVAITIPSVREDGDQRSHDRSMEAIGYLSPSLKYAIDLRIRLNQMIAKACREMNIPVVDWFTGTSEPETNLLIPEYSNDGLHLTTLGYKKLAELLWHCVLKEWLANLDG